MIFLPKLSEFRWETKSGKKIRLAIHINIATQPYLKKNTLFYRKLISRTYLRNLTILLACHRTDLPHFRDEQIPKSGTVLIILISDVNVVNRSRWSMTMLRCYKYARNQVYWLKCPFVLVFQILQNTLYLITHSVNIATANCEDTRITIYEILGHILIRSTKDSENNVESH